MSPKVSRLRDPRSAGRRAGPVEYTGLGGLAAGKAAG